MCRDEKKGEHRTAIALWPQLRNSCTELSTHPSSAFLTVSTGSLASCSSAELSARVKLASHGVEMALAPAIVVLKTGMECIGFFGRVVAATGDFSRDFRV